MDKLALACVSQLLQTIEEKLDDLYEEFELISNLEKFQDESYKEYYLLIRVINSNKTDRAKLLIEKGFRVYKVSKSRQERTVLHAAVHSGDQDLIRILMTKGAAPDILAFDEQNKTPFHLAIDMNQMTTVELFLAQFDAKIFDEKYLLHYAIEKNDMQVVSHLVAKGLSLKKKNEKGMTPFCVASNNQNLKILDFLLLHHTVKNDEPNDHDDIAPAYIAILFGNLKAIKKYATSGLSINNPLNLGTNTWPCLQNLLYEPKLTLLHVAVKLVKLKIVKFLLSVGADILVKNESGSSPLHVAFESKEIGIWKTWQDFHDNNAIIDLILKAHAKFNSNPVNKNGLSHFHIACSRDEPKVVEYFLKLGASVNAPVKPQCHLYKKFSPLHFAAKFRCQKTMEVLLKNGADVKQRDFQRMTALHIAARESCLETVSLLLKYGADVASIDSYGKTPVHWAFENKCYKIIDLLISALNFTKSNPANRQGISHFHIACTRNNVNVVKRFIEKRRVVIINNCVPVKSEMDESPSVTDWSGFSPLHFAVSHNRPDIVQLLLQRGANVGIKNSRGHTPLHTACQYTLETFGEFIENMLCDLSKLGHVTQNFHPLTDVVRADEKYFKFTGLFTSNKHGYERKMNWLVSKKDHLKIINLLLDYESDVNCIDNNGNTSLFHAYAAPTEIESTLENTLPCTESLWNEIVDSLSKELCERRKLIINNFLALDVDLEKCYENRSILHGIVTNPEEDKHSDELLELFLKRGANVDATDDNMLTPLYLATSESYNHVRILLDYNANVDCIDPEDNSTPLLKAASSSSGHIMQLLLDKKANPDARRSDGRTALHILASKRQSTTKLGFSALIEAGADVDSRDLKGRTPLHLACKVKNNNVLNKLLTSGADVHVEDNKGRTVYCYLYEKHLDEDDDEDVPSGVTAMIEILQKHVIKMNVIGLTIGEKVLSSNAKFDDFWPLDDDEEVELIEQCQKEVQIFRDTQIHGSCTLFDAIFKSENALSHLVKIPTFRSIYTVNCKLLKDTYPQYGDLVQLKYRTGVERGDLLSKAKILFSELAGLHMPETCFENICKFFKNAALKESIGILRGALDLKMEKSGDIIQLRSRKVNKRQKVYF